VRHSAFPGLLFFTHVFKSFSLSFSLDFSRRSLPSLPSSVSNSRSFTQFHRYYLNFEAVDFGCEVWVNDLPVGGHSGGSTPFRLDVSDAVAAAELPGAQNDQLAHELVGLYGTGSTLQSV